MRLNSTEWLARRQAKDIERVTRRSAVMSSRFWKLIVGSLRNRTYSDIVYAEELNLDPVLEELVGLMAYAYLLRKRLESRRKSTEKFLKLASSTDVELNKIARQFELNLDNIKEKFEPLARARVARTAADLRKTVNTALGTATSQGMSTDAATEHVIRRLRKIGVQPRSSPYVETLVRTHASVGYNAALYLDHQGEEDLWGYEYVTMADDRVREEHEALHGVRRKKDDPFWDSWWPPNGWNCRCQVVAIYAEEGLRQTPVPNEPEIEEDFDFNPGQLF